MNETLPTFDWAAARGEKWLAHLPQMEAMLAPVDDPLIRALRLDAPYRIADIACGGGGTSLEIARRAPEGSFVHGFDISPALIDLARGRLPADSGAIAFETADMATSAPPEKPYDRLVSRFGVMFFNDPPAFFNDPPAAFANLARWLAPGGRFAFAVWAPIDDNPWMASVRDAVRAVIDLPAPAPDAPGPFRYAKPDVLLDLLTEAGFGALDVHDWRGRLAIGGDLPPAEAAAFALNSFSIAEPLAQADEPAFANALRLLTECFSLHQESGAVEMEACVHIVTGVRL